MWIVYHEGGELGTVILPMRVLAPKAQGVHPGAPKSAWGFPLASGSQFFSVTEGRDFSNPGPGRRKKEEAGSGR
jgi:hypothetical protein